jgi:haloalkane dehalogenase
LTGRHVTLGELEGSPSSRRSSGRSPGTTFRDRRDPRVEALRTPGVGETKVLDENFFIEFAIRATVLGELSDEEHDVYRKPYSTRDSRRPLLEWPRALPIEGEPADVVARVEAYGRWLASSDDVPKLLLTFDGTAETLLVGPELIAWCEANIANLEVRNCGIEAHLAPEEQPEAIAAAVAERADRHELRSHHPPGSVNVA